MKVRPPQFFNSTFKASAFVLLFWIGGCLPVQGQCTLGCLPGPIEFAIGSEGFSKLRPEYFIAFESQECQGSNSVLVIETGSDTVDCNMVGGTYTVRVTNDASGNFCSTQIRVVDNIVPEMECPVDVTLHCDRDFRDTTLTGVPVVVENCEATISFSDDLSGLNECGLGLVERTWRAEDPSGLSTSCKQLIEVLDTLPPSVQFPSDITLQCGQDPLDLSLTGRPVYSDNCGSLDDGFTDLSFELCSPGTKRILRNWSVVDFCNANGPYGQYAHAQTIVIRDTVPPEFVCPAPDTIGTDPLSDMATYKLTQPDSSSDNCSGVIYSYLALSAAGDTLVADSAMLMFPLGSNLIRHYLQDSCGNVDSCDQLVAVLDDEDPQVVCFPSVQFSLGGEAIYVTPDQLFRDASDNTTPDSLLDIQIKRDSVWQDSILFDCADVNQTELFVQVRVKDAFGNFNLCDVQILLRDITAPVLECPSDLTLDCGEALDSLGTPQIWDNCQWELSHRDDLSGLNTCGFGTVYRTWRVEDASGNKDSCVQAIEIAFSGQPQFTQPPDVTVACGQDISPSVTGEPSFVDDCSRLIYAIEDRSFSGGPDYVEIIRRTFEIGDLCRPTYSEEFEQLLYIVDRGSPTLDCQAEDAYYLHHDSCDIRVEIPLGISDNCSTAFEFGHNSPSGEIVDNYFIAELGVGQYDILVEVTDESGNADQCQLNFQVLDTIAPAPVCRTGLSLPLPDSGVLVPPARLFDLGSSDNCTPDNQLELRLLPERFDCFDRGANDLQLIIRDASGNETVCQSQIFVTDPNEYCPRTDHDLAGMILDAHHYYPLASQPVEVIIDGDSSLVWTDSAGWYRLEDVADGAAVTINPVAGESLKDGLSTTDIVLLQSHLLERRTFQNPAEFLAADVNESGEVSNLDVLFIRRAILQTVAGFPGKDLMRSMNYHCEIEGGADQVLDIGGVQEMYMLDSLSGDRNNLHFLVSKKGDVNGSFARDFRVQQRSSCDSSFILRTVEQEIAAGDKASLFLISDRDIALAGLQFGIVFDGIPMEFFEFGSRGKLQPGVSDYNYIEEEGKLLVSWSDAEDVWLEQGDTLVEMIFGATQEINWPTGVRLSQSFTPEVVDSDFQVYGICPNLQLTAIDERSGDGTWQGVPNPFQQVLHITADEHSKEEVHIAVFDLMGRKVIDLGMKTAGVYSIDTSSWPPGIYLLSVEGRKTSSTRKLIKR